GESAATAEKNARSHWTPQRALQTSLMNPIPDAWPLRSRWKSSPRLDPLRNPRRKPDSHIVSRARARRLSRQCYRCQPSGYRFLRSDQPDSRKESIPKDNLQPAQGPGWTSSVCDEVWLPLLRVVML